MKFWEILELSDYEETLLKIYKLAKEDIVINSEEGFIDFDDIIEDTKSEGVGKKLLHYMNKLDREILLVVMTVMYIGRDYENKKPSDDLSEFFWRSLDSFKKDKNFDDKEVIIDQIYGKMHLDDYLERAFDILEISY